jgi:outer membrane biosynthesis protein TonB
VLIALAHVALIAGIIRWSVAARASSNPESIVWLGGAENVAAATESAEAEAPENPTPLATPPTKDEAEEKKPLAITAKSEIELPSPTPKPTPRTTPSPKPTATSAPRPKPTPKPLPKPTPRKIVVAKASPKSSAKAKASPSKLNEKPEKNQKAAPTRRGGLPSAVSGGGSSASEFGWYGHMLHDRFYSAWIQPTTSVPSSLKFSALVNVRIEKDGRVSKFEIIKPSENVVVNESVAAIAKRISEVDAPPTGLIKGDHYDVKINFELNTDQAPAKD